MRWGIIQPLTPEERWGWELLFSGQAYHVPYVKNRSYGDIPMGQMIACPWS